MSKHLWVNSWVKYPLAAEYTLLWNWLYLSFKHAVDGNFCANMVFFLFFPPWHCSVMSRLKIKTKKKPQQTIFHRASNRFNTDGIFQLPFKHWYTEFICRRALLGLDLWGDASLFKIMKNISFYEKPTNPLGRTEAFISKLNCFCPLFLENLQGASRFSVLMFAISTKRKCPSPYFS